MGLKVKLGGFAPDIDQTEAGILTACQGIIPTMRGIASAPTPSSINQSALAAACIGASSLFKLDRTSRVFAGTTTKLYEASGTSWTDRTRTVGGNYNGTSTMRWRFAQFGDVSLAAQKGDKIQFSSAGAFADIAAAPKASIIEVVNNFVLAFDTNDGVNDYLDGWYCSALGDYTDWTPSIATQSASGRLSSAPGKIVGAKKLGETIVVYKEKFMYQGEYSGPDDGVWRFREIPGEIGAVSHESIVDIGYGHVFQGYDDFYLFDGTRPIPIGTPEISEWFSANVSKTHQYLSQAMHDRSNGRVYFYYPSSSSNGTLDSCLIYDYIAKKWGVDDRQIEFCFEYISPGVTYDSLGTYFSTYADLPDIAYDAPPFSGAAPTIAIFDTSHVLKTMTGASTGWSFTTSEYGDDQGLSFVDRIIPRFRRTPTTAQAVHRHRMSLSDTITEKTPVQMSNNRFDVMQDSRWHSVTISGTGNMELIGMDFRTESDGDE